MSHSGDWPKEAYEPVEAHLDAVEEVLFEAGVSRRERGAILDELQGQINEMLASRFGDDVTVEQVQGLVDELEPPGKYAGDGEPRAKRVRRAKRDEPRLSRWVLVGTAIAVAPFCLFFLTMLVDQRSFLMELFALLLYLSLPLAVVGSPFCGLRALREIERNPDLRYGRAWATVLFVLPVMAAGNGLVFAVALMFGEAGLYLLSLAALVFFNVWAFRHVMRFLRWITAAVARPLGRWSGGSVSALAT